MNATVICGDAPLLAEMAGYAMAELYRACMVMAEGWARGAEGYRMVLRVPEAPA